MGPVLDELRGDLGLGGLGTGLLTALPGACFGVVGAGSVALARRTGLSRGIALCLLLVALGLLARSAVGAGWAFLALSAVALSGMAIGNVLVPAWIKRHTSPDGVGAMTVYSVGLTLGAAVAALVTAPLRVVLPGGWRTSLALWGVVALVALLPWCVLAAREGRARRAAGADAARSTVSTSVLSSPTAWALTGLFAIQSMNAYVQFGWLPQIYRDGGVSAGAAGAYLALLTSLGVLGAAFMPTVIRRSSTLAPWMVAMGVLLVAGYLGLLLAPATLPWLWAVLLGLSGFAFPTAIALITARTKDPSVTASLSGHVQSLGYTMAAIGPFVVGVLHDVTGGWALVLILLMTSGLGLTLAGLKVSRPVLVDDEIRSGG